MRSAVFVGGVAVPSINGSSNTHTFYIKYSDDGNTWVDYNNEMEVNVTRHSSPSHLGPVSKDILRQIVIATLVFLHRVTLQFFVKVFLKRGPKP